MKEPSLATPLGWLAPVMKFCTAPVPARSARPIVAEPKLLQRRRPAPAVAGRGAKSSVTVARTSPIAPALRLLRAAIIRAECSDVSSAMSWGSAAEALADD